MTIKTENKLVKAVMYYVIPLLSLAFAVGVTYATLSGSIEKVEEDIKAHTAQMKMQNLATGEVSDTCQQNKQDIAVLKTDIRYIKDGVDDIKVIVNGFKKP